MLHTPRLDLVAADAALLEAEMRGVGALGEALSAAVPSDWPPGEHDSDALQFFHERARQGGSDTSGWYAWYAVRRACAEHPVTIVGTGGYFGPPDRTGRVELGYSVCPSWRRQGLASEMVAALVGRAFADARVTCVVAETRPDNAASIAVLARAGFASLGAGRDADHRRFGLLRPEK